MEYCLYFASDAYDLPFKKMEKWYAEITPNRSPQQPNHSPSFPRNPVMSAASSDERALQRFLEIVAVIKVRDPKLYARNFACHEKKAKKLALKLYLERRCSGHHPGIFAMKE